MSSRVATLACAIGLLSHAGAARADAGQDLFHGHGGGIAILREELEVPARQFACASCHEQDGLGGREGAYIAPPITWRLLAKPNATRRAYSSEALARLLTTGIDSEGRPIALLMPRYRLEPAELTALEGYLGRVEDEATTGVGDDAIRFAVPFGPGEERAAQQLAGALGAALQRLGAPTLFGRHITIEAVPAATAAVAAFAILMPPIRDKEFYDRMRQRRIPVVAPLHGVEGNEDKQSIRGLFASRREQWSALHRQAPVQAPVVVAADGDMELDLETSFPGRKRISTKEWPAAGANAVILPGGLDHIPSASLNIAPNVKIYSTVDGSARTARSWLARGASLVLADPRPARGGNTTTRRPDIDRLADATAQTIVRTLERVGRDVSRRRFMLAIDEISFTLADWPPVNFGDTGLTGSRDVAFISLTP